VATGLALPPCAPPSLYLLNPSLNPSVGLISEVDPVSIRYARHNVYLNAFDSLIEIRPARRVPVTITAAAPDAPEARLLNILPGTPVGEGAEARPHSRVSGKGPPLGGSDGEAPPCGDSGKNTPLMGDEGPVSEALHLSDATSEESLLEGVVHPQEQFCAGAAARRACEHRSGRGLRGGYVYWHV